MQQEYKSDDFKNVTNDLFYHLTENRINTALFLGNNLDMLEYDNIKKIIENICNDKNVFIHELLRGTTDYNHNSRMSISILPTKNLYRIIVKILNRFSLTRLEDIGSGIGLVPYMLKCFNEEQRKINNNNELTFVGIEPKYQLSTSITLNGVHLLNRDISDYITNEQNIFDQNTAYMFVDPVFMIDDVLKFLKYRRPTTLIIISEHPYPSEIHEYKATIINPKIISYHDTLYNISEFNQSTNFKMYIYSNIILNSDLFARDLLLDIKDISINTVYSLVENKKIPNCCLHLNESDASELLKQLYNLKLLIIPLHLKNLDEVNSYLYFYSMAYSETGIYPDILENREKFLALRKYVEMIFTNFNTLIELAVIPKSVSQDRAFSFLLIDYSYSDKMTRNICNEYTNRLPFS